MSGNVKRAAAAALAAHIEAAIATLAGKCYSVAAEPEDYAEFPSLYVLPGEMELEPLDEATLDAEAGVLCVGWFTGTWELRIPHRTPFEREELEQQVIDLFFATEGAPGLIGLAVVPQVGGATPTQPVACSFRLAKSEWQEEKAFSKKRYAYLDVEAEIPALVYRDSAVDAGDSDEGVHTSETSICGGGTEPRIDQSANVPIEEDGLPHDAIEFL